ncbi:MAG: M20/M25/M40 family metallo-hydrolase [Anaerolineales bacterium]|nr:M20/M25/M40 family metallo-hydrolase [Anaerolineales bacterium]
MKALLKTLSEAYGPSGAEDQVREVVRAEVRKLADYVTVDPLGNLIAVVKQQSKTGKKIMLAAHMDEIGFAVTHVDAAGFARVLPSGGVNPLASVGQRVRFANGRLGVVGLDARRDDLGKPPTLSEMFIDLGASSRAANPVQVGDVAGFWRPLEDLGGRLIGKSLDDRVGVAILIETLRALKRTPHEVAFVFTVQEEIGLRGAGVAAFGLDADLGLALDVTRTGDTPNGPKMETALGAGPAIKVRDARMLTDPRIKELLLARAREAKIPTQLEVLEGGTTDAAAMQLARGGLPVGCVSVPARYIHTPSEMVDYGDVQQCVALLLAVLHKPIEL